MLVVWEHLELHHILHLQHLEESYSALPQNTFASGKRSKVVEICILHYLVVVKQLQLLKNSFAAGMEQGAKNVYAKPAFIKPQQKPANLPPNQLGQNLLDFATSPQGRGFARGLLEASGYSTTPVSFGQALAQGLGYKTEADQGRCRKETTRV